MGPVVYMGSTKLFVGALGMGLAFAPVALYPYYVHHARVWGISALDDQSIAGLIMAVEQSLVMGIALVVLFVRRWASPSASSSAANASIPSAEQGQRLPSGAAAPVAQWREHTYRMVEVSGFESRRGHERLL